MSTAPSDKAFKTAAHKRARRAVKACDLTQDDAPSHKAFGNQWAAPKDGKQWVDAKRFPEVMRK
jgi:hypothetical protein